MMVLCGIIASVCFWRPSAAQDLRLFSYDPSQVPFQCEVASTSRAIRRIRVTFPSQVESGYPENRTVYASLYEPTGRTGVPGVVVLDVLRTEKGAMSRALCEQLARGGIAAIQVELPYHQHRTPTGYRTGELFLAGSPDQFVQTMRQSVVDVRCAIDFLCSRPDVDANRIGITGMSLGAVVTLLAAQVDDRISAAVSILGCAEPASLIWHSELLGPTKDRLRDEGYTEADLTRTLQPVNAAAYPPHEGQCALLMINGLHDWVMPRQAVRRTWEALGKPDLIWIPSGHFSAFITRGALFNEGIRFLAIELGTRPGPYRPRRLRTVAVRAGVLGSPGAPTMGAVMLEAFHFDSKGRTSLDVGGTTHGAMAGVSGRLAHHISVGFGTFLGEGRPRARGYWMGQVDF